MVKDGLNDHQVREAMKKNGMITIADKLRDMLISGETSYEEAIRVGLDGWLMLKRPAFTIIEVLIAIALMGIILPALYESVALLRDSNTHLFSYLEKAKKGDTGNRYSLFGL